MARATIISPVSGKTDWYLVEDDLDVRYEVQSAVAGFGYRTGEDYRLFVPDGEYHPCAFRLLPYKTSRRFISADELADSRPASAAALYFYAEKMREFAVMDKKRTINAIKPGVAIFEEGGCAKIPESDDGLYGIGDCVAVLHDLEPATADDHCITPGVAEAWVAGFACDQTPRALSSSGSCSTLSEQFTGYPTRNADLAGGSFTFEKPGPAKGRIAKWIVSTGGPYAGDGQPYGAAANVSLDGSLRIKTLAIDIQPDYYEGQQLESSYPRPTLMPPTLGMYAPTTEAVLSPPVIAQASVSKNPLCGGRKLKMTVNILTADERNHYTDVDGYGSGLQLPACLVLVFSDSAYPGYLGGSTVNGNLYTTGYPDYQPKFASVMECNLDKNFALLYAAPGGRNFSILRETLPGAGSPGQYALYRPEPRRQADGSFAPVGGNVDIAQRKLNVPTTDPETGFSHLGLLPARSFDYYGADITPAPQYFSSGGLFPGYFEIASGGDEKRDIYVDFLAAYPFMKNPDINAGGALPTLGAVYFYAQGKVYLDGGNVWRANPSLCECKKLNFFYE